MDTGEASGAMKKRRLDGPLPKDVTVFTVGSDDIDGVDDDVELQGSGVESSDPSVSSASSSSTSSSNSDSSANTVRSLSDVSNPL